MTNIVMKYFPAVMLFSLLMLLLLTSTSPVYIPVVYAHNDLSADCKIQVSKSIQRQKDAAGRQKELKLAAYGIGGTLTSIGAGAVLSGPVLAPAGALSVAAIAGAAVISIIRRYDRAIRNFERQEDREHEQCEIDAAMEISDAAENSDEGQTTANSGSTTVFGLGSGTTPPRGTVTVHPLY